VPAGQVLVKLASVPAVLDPSVWVITTGVGAGALLLPARPISTPTPIARRSTPTKAITFSVLLRLLGSPWGGAACGGAAGGELPGAGAEEAPSRKPLIGTRRSPHSRQ
jgi:hypothetical protein